ncbi:PREDICTED: RISC-loading complex subunit TARBP2-like [Wasmannia auropunctata]|uniref:RISC-loading complex subunit TARBP2-like n=1 Tax=Wasmannia auropunctata TaxID=64793 RepID=UPI0005EDA9C4|nr:PREDICTED: RISC-loading complex subunit TARBP2-like [Wasmannia auropunctata]
MMVKQSITPDYELIHDGGGRHVNTFTYRVTCDGLSATGTGRCKKDAKHEAAKAMLAEIAAHRNYPQLPAATTPTVSPSRSPFHSVPPLPRTSANVPFFNAVGELQELCAENNLKEPEYTPIRDVGPPHARIFTIRCKVSNFEDKTLYRNICILFNNYESTFLKIFLSNCFYALAGIINYWSIFVPHFYR